MIKHTVKFKELFEKYATNVDDELVPLNKPIYIKSLDGRLVKVKGVIRKTKQVMVICQFENGITHRCSDGHLLKTEDGILKVNDIIMNKTKIILSDNSYTYLTNIIKYDETVAYDIEIDTPHLYSTPNKLIHHNTTTARILVDQIIKDDMDLLKLNGSESTGIDTIRNEILGFLKIPPLSSKIKIIFIDEFDYMSSNAQAALRNIMENYADNGRFICTANYKSKIIDPLFSRFQMFEMKTIKEDFAVKYCTGILDKESIQYDSESVKLIVKMLMPDVRKAVNTIQQYVSDGKLKKIDVASLTSMEKKVCGYIIQMCDNINKDTRDNVINSNTALVLKSISENDLDYREIYQSLFDNNSIPLWAKIKINQYANSHQSAAIPAIHFSACMHDIILSGMNFYRLFGDK